MKCWRVTEARTFDVDAETRAEAIQLIASADETDWMLYGGPSTYTAAVRFTYPDTSTATQGST